MHGYNCYADSQPPFRRPPSTSNPTPPPPPPAIREEIAGNESTLYNAGTIIITFSNPDPAYPDISGPYKCV